MSDSTRVQSPTDPESRFARKRFQKVDSSGASFQEELLNIQFIADQNSASISSPPSVSDSATTNSTGATGTEKTDDKERDREKDGASALNGPPQITANVAVPTPIQSPVAADPKVAPSTQSNLENDQLAAANSVVKSAGDQHENNDSLALVSESEQGSKNSLVPQPLESSPVPETNAFPQSNVATDSNTENDSTSKKVDEHVANRKGKTQTNQLSTDTKADSTALNAIDDHPIKDTKHVESVLKSESGSSRSQDKQNVISQSPETSGDLPKGRRQERLERNRNSDSGNESGSTDRVHALSEPVDAPVDPTSSQQSVNLPTSTDAVLSPPNTDVLSTVDSAPISAPTMTPSVGSLPATSVIAQSGAAHTSSSSSPSSTLAGIGPSGVTSHYSNTKLAETAGGSRTSLTQYQETKLVQRVMKGLEKLADGGGQVRLRLHPPELGSLQMTLKIEGNQVSAQLEVENPTAKDALLQNSQVLKDRLSEQGLNIERFDVQVRSDSSGSNPSLDFGANQQERNGSRWEQRESRYAVQNNNRLESANPSEVIKQQVSWVRTQGSLDLTV